jgi:TorA maturation chaperone TorD
MPNIIIDKRDLTAAAEWRLLALLFERPRAAWREEVQVLMHEISDQALRSAAAAALRSASEGSYLALLGPGGAVSPREVSYRPFEDPGWLLADLSRTYEAFAYRPRAEDPLDHVSVEIGFVGYLHLKEAFARAIGEGQAAASTAEAREKFLQQHLASFTQPFHERLAAAGDSYLIATARLLAAKTPTPPPIKEIRSRKRSSADLCSVCPFEQDET